MWFTDTFAVQNLQGFEPSTDKVQNTGLLDAFFNGGVDKTTNDVGGTGIQNFILKVAKDFKNVVFALSSIIFLVLVYKLLFASNSEEEIGKFRKGVTWTIIWVVVMQLSYVAVAILFDEDVDDALAENLVGDLFFPIIDLLLLWASFAFLFTGIIAFYLMITANGDEEKTKKWKQTVLYAVAWFLVIKFASILVNSSYAWTYNQDGSTATWLIDLMSRIINWVTPFLWLVIVIMIMYTGFQLITWWGDEEKFKKAKKSIIYIFIWLLILVMNFLIVTFFLQPEVPLALL